MGRINADKANKYLSELKIRSHNTIHDEVTVGIDILADYVEAKVSEARVEVAITALKEFVNIIYEFEHDGDPYGAVNFAKHLFNGIVSENKIQQNTITNEKEV